MLIEIVKTRMVVTMTVTVIIKKTVMVKMIKVTTYIKMSQARL